MISTSSPNGNRLIQAREEAAILKDGRSRYLSHYLVFSSIVLLIIGIFIMGMVVLMALAKGLKY